MASHRSTRLQNQLDAEIVNIKSKLEQALQLLDNTVEADPINGHLLSTNIKNLDETLAQYEASLYQLVTRADPNVTEIIMIWTAICKKYFTKRNQVVDILQRDFADQPTLQMLPTDIVKFKKPTSSRRSRASSRSTRTQHTQLTVQQPQQSAVVDPQPTNADPAAAAENEIPHHAGSRHGSDAVWQQEYTVADGFVATLRPQAKTATISSSSKSSSSKRSSQLSEHGLNDYCRAIKRSSSLYLLCMRTWFYSYSLSTTLAN